MRKPRLLFYFITLSVLILGAVAIFLSLLWEKNRSLKILEAFGEAMLIASFLSLTVDRYIKWEMLKEVSRDVSEFLIGYQLPAEAQAKIRELMACRIIRENFDLHWHIAETQQPGKVKVVTSFSFDVKNITSETEDYQQVVVVETRDNPTIGQLECDSSDKSGRYSLDGAKISHEKVGEHGVIEALGTKIAIKPNRESNEPHYRVGASYSMILPEEWSDVFAFGGPTLKVTVSADVPDNFAFVAPDADMKTAHSWRYNKFYLPNQHLRVRWFKVKP
jgi:hypothetical protein